MSNLVSIIMPSYNTAKYISEAIKSVLSQTYTNWELLIVDDCSADETEEIISGFKDDRIKYYKNKQRLGAALTRNIALQKATGKYIAFLDSDDVWLENKLEKMLNFMQSNDYKFAYHNYEKIDEESNSLGVYVTGPKVVNHRKMYHYDYIGCLTFIYDAKEIGLIQIEDVKKNNDYAILLKVSKKADCYLLNENLAKYRIRKKSISHDGFMQKVKCHYKLFRICEKKSVIASVFFACQNMFYGAMKKIGYENSEKIIVHCRKDKW